ncbi:serine protease|nr:serine protease [Candidatus Pantoea persica]
MPSDAAPYDYGLVILRNPPSAINPIPLFDGSRSDLTSARKEAGRKVTQAGYPERTATLLHQCDTLPGDSGSPLLLKNANVWQLIAVQSSAPEAKDRYLADNRAIAVTSFRDRLEALAQ